MPIFVLFVFGALVLGAGTLLSPAIPTVHPRIGLAGVVALALIIGGGVDAASLTQWNTLFIDYIWFALIVIVFLSGSFSAGMFRAESAGGTRDLGWPGPRELMFLLTVAIVLAVPVLTLPVPLDTDAQGFGYLAFMIRQGGTLTTLLPFHPEVQYLYSPGFPMLVAYLSSQLHAGIQNVELALGAAFSFLFVWIAYDFGSELDPEGGRRTGIAFAGCTLLGTGLLFTDLDSHYTTLMALCFALAFVTFTLRWLRKPTRLDFLAAAATLACVPLSHPDTTIVLALGYVPWLVTIWFARPRPNFRQWLILAIGIPLLAGLLIAPWIVHIAPLLGSSIHSPFTISLSDLWVMFAYHGGLVVILSIIGIVVAFRRRTPADLLMIGWLVLIVDFSSFGIIAHFLPDALNKYSYPFSIAWHGPIIPYMYLAGTALLWLIDHFGRKRIEKILVAISLPILTAVALIALLIIAFTGQAVTISKATPLRIFGTFSSLADVHAMQWIQRNTAPDALILNHPGPQEGDWAPVVAERNTVYFRPQPFFMNNAQVNQMQSDLLTFWRAPTDANTMATLTRYQVKYVLEPQIVTDPNTLTGMDRWRPPSADAILNVDLSKVSYLHLVFDEDGARVYQVMLP